MTDDVASPQPVGGEKVAPETAARAGSPFGFAEPALVFVGDVALLALRALGTVARGRLNLGDLVTQMAAVGADSIWIVLIITTATGAVFSLYASVQAIQIGFTQFVGGGLAYTFLNELGPVLGGVALAARSGAAIAAEIGSMVVTEQVDALRAMAVSPIRYLVAPRVVAALIMLPLLTVIADVAGVYGGYVLASAEGIRYATFWDSVYQYARVSNLMQGLFKALVFGFLVGIVSCQQGLRTKGGATGVGRATTNSVVLCVVLIFVADFCLTLILHH